MKVYIPLFGAFVSLVGIAYASDVYAQVPVTETPNQARLLASADPKLAVNKKLVYAFWREVLEARHVEFADKFLAESYIQHNPNIATGRNAFVEAFSKGGPPREIAPTIKRKLINIVAEGDYVVLSFVYERPQPQDAAKTYTTTWFDTFRIENGKIAEHWDSALKELP